MPVFNQVRYVGEAIKSVLNSTERDLELIVVDDGSTDGSRAIIESAAASDERIKPFYRPANLGVSLARNHALKMATGEYIAFCDADDVWLPAKLKIQLALLAQNPAAGITYGEAKVIDGEGRETGALFSHRFPVPGTGSGNLFKVLCVRNFINMQTALLRRDILTEAHYFDPDLSHGEDWLFWVKLSRTHSFIYSPEVLGSYRVHEGSTASSAPERLLRNRIKVYLAILHFADRLPRTVLSQVFYHLAVALDRLNEPEEEAKRLYKYSAKRAYRSALIYDPFNLKAALRLILCTLRK